MAAANMDNGRWGHQPNTSQAADKDRYTYGRVTIRLFPTEETREERQTRHALATGTSRKAWK